MRWLRRVAGWFLRSAVDIAPPHVAEWGRAMLGELHHVKGDWTALMWAMSSTGFLARSAFCSLFMPDPNLRWFLKADSMRKNIFIATTVCLALSLLFFAAPSYRQAFQISLTHSHSLLEGLFVYSWPQADFAVHAKQDFTKIGEDAKKNHDAEGLAFAAIHSWWEPNLADEAVSLDPQLVWIYAFTAGRNAWRPCSQSFSKLYSQDVDRISRLAQFDPQNAVPHILQAQQIRMFNGKCAPNVATQSAIWQSAMEAAFASSRLDTYSDRMTDLNHKIAVRYGLSPYVAADLMMPLWNVPSGMGSPQYYAQLLLDSGDALAAEHNYQDAAKKYMLAAHFGEMMQPREEQSLEGMLHEMFADNFREDPYQRLAALYQKQGEKEQAALFTSMAARARARREHNSGQPFWHDNLEIAARDAHIFELSGITMFYSVTFICLYAIIRIARSRSLQFKDGLITLPVCAGAAGILFSSIGLCWSYRPYAKNLAAYLRDGNTNHLTTLGAFFGYLDCARLYNLPDYLFYFWLGVGSLCVAGLIFATAIFLLRRPSQAVAV